MKQELEIEFKNLVSEKDFHKIMDTFQLKEDQLKKQTNHYFDTPDFSLKAQRSALRIRHIEEGYVLTLKQPSQGHLLESHEILTDTVSREMISSSFFPEGGVRELVEQMGISPKEIRYLGSLTTYRTQVAYKSGLLFFDRSHYLGTIDYEIEYECDDDKSGAAIFSALMDELSIPIVKTENKIQRFFNFKQQQ
ncbi:CYTH domain-containing protein [Fictibacillus iocasae]|uniref:CYTH domain-containing protein n=1 Tax=Fictibacillus iocasae TaxID=2715437 RepID=A0ABW2NS71_9BACL